MLIGKQDRWSKTIKAEIITGETSTTGDWIFDIYNNYYSRSMSAPSIGIGIGLLSSVTSPINFGFSTSASAENTVDCSWYKETGKGFAKGVRLEYNNIYAMKPGDEIITYFHVYTEEDLNSEDPVWYPLKAKILRIPVYEYSSTSSNAHITDVNSEYPIYAWIEHVDDEHGK